MIITLSGVTGVGKSFFKNVIAQELNFNNLAIVTTRPKRKDEINGIDKIFVTNEEFQKLKDNGELSVDFEFLNEKYAYKKQNIQSNKNQVTELHYSTIYEFKKATKNVFPIYMIPYDLERAKVELRKRNLPENVEKKRLKEIEEHLEEFSKNQQLQKQFDYIFINDYTEYSKNKLLKIIEEKLKEKAKS